MAQLRKVGYGQVISIGNVIDKGIQSVIFSGEFDDKAVAVKRLLRDDELAEELKILREVDHQNVVRYLFKDIDDDFLYIVLEKCKYTLLQVMTKNMQLPSLGPYEILQQITTGLHYLHTVKDLIHRDLKPSNILLICKENIWIVKISDFGISKQLSQNRTSLTQTSQKGTVGYVAPELLNKEKIRKASDIFSLGVVFYFVVSGGGHPFGQDNFKIEGDIHDGITPPLDSIKERFIADMKTLISSMIAHDWKKRLVVEQVLAHHIFWKAQKTLEFVQDVSDYLISPGHEQLVSDLENKCSEITDGDWREKLYEESNVVQRTFEGMRNKRQKTGIFDLLRNIRNLKHHFHEKELSLQQQVGDIPDRFLTYFTSRFPKLIPHTHDVMSSKKQNPMFHRYYKISHSVRLEVDEPWHHRRSLREELSGREYLCDDVSKGRIDIEDASSGNSGELKLRSYQWELAQQALDGHNSLVIAPTGSGKTAVAKGIIEKHLSNPDARSVLFIVSTTALARQQFEFFSRNLSDIRSKMVYLIGENTAEAPVGAVIKGMKLTILTPQILVNELSRKKSFLSFNDISLMVFDECHNVTKRHPYKVIMNMLLDFHHDDSNHQSIQIVGMTASPGIGKGKSRDDVLQNLITLLANMDITLCPAMVIKNADELKLHQNEISESFVRVEMESVFSKKVNAVMEQIESRIRGMEILGTAEGQYCNPPKDRSKQSYESWAINLMNHASLDKSSSRIVATYAEHLQMYYNVLYFKKFIKNAMEVLKVTVNFDQTGDEMEFLNLLHNGCEELPYL